MVLRDGGTARIRPITTEDAERLVSFYEQVSDESKYYRFFAPYPRLSAKDVHRFTHHDYVDRVGLAATVGGEFIATVRYDRINAQGRPASAPADEAEVAFLVQDAHQGRGVASTLLEHIAAVARERGHPAVRGRGAARQQQDDQGVHGRRVPAEARPSRTARSASPSTWNPPPNPSPCSAPGSTAPRRRSVRRLLAPGSVAVIGAGRAPGGVGRAVLRNLLDAGFTGRVYAVNRALAAERRGDRRRARRSRSVGAIGEPVDLASSRCPPNRCPKRSPTAASTASRAWSSSPPATRRAARGAGSASANCVRQARSYGMRLIGPNAFGIINTAAGRAAERLAGPRVPARAAGSACSPSPARSASPCCPACYRRGAGLSTFISSGNRADLSGNDFLQYWYEDPDTDVVLLYLESIGNPRKFTRLARRTAAAKPVVVVKGARHSGIDAAGPRGPGDPGTGRHGLRAAAPGRRHPGRHGHRTRRRGPAPRRPAAARGPARGDPRQLRIARPPRPTTPV